MKFYELNKVERLNLKNEIINKINTDNKGFLECALNNDINVRKIASRACGVKSNYEHLITLMNHEDYRVRQSVSYALGFIGISDLNLVIKDLRKLARDTNHNVIEACIESLKNLARSNASLMIKSLIPWLNDDNPRVRCCAINGVSDLGNYPPSLAFKLLKHSFNDSSMIVEKGLIKVIVKLSIKSGAVSTLAELHKLRHKAPLSLINKVSSEILKYHKNHPINCRDSFIEVKDFLQKIFKEY